MKKLFGIKKERAQNIPNKAGPSFSSHNDTLLAKIKESEEGKGQVQMTSGGFGSAQQPDEATLLRVHQN